MDDRSKSGKSTEISTKVYVFRLELWALSEEQVFFFPHHASQEQGQGHQGRRSCATEEGRATTGKEPRWAYVNMSGALWETCNAFLPPVPLG